jgi:pimeloyl-ACP methyl ester carboxylesterase
MSEDGDPEPLRTFRTPDGAVIAYRLWRPAPGRPLLVLLHGMASNMTRWSEFARATALRASWDLLRLDLRGHAASVHRGRVGVAEWCGDLAALLAAEGYERAVVAGHCLGANVAVEFALRHRSMTIGLVLVEPMLRSALTGPARRLARLRPLLLGLARAAGALNRLGVRRRRLPPLDLEALDRESRAAMGTAGGEALLERYASPWLDLRTTPTATYLRALCAVTGGVPDLAAVGAPVLALLASGSRFTDLAVTEAALRALPHLRLVKLPARHWIPTEQPEAMRHAIEQWCLALGAASGP